MLIPQKYTVNELNLHAVVDGVSNKLQVGPLVDSCGHCVLAVAVPATTAAAAPDLCPPFAAGAVAVFLVEFDLLRGVVADKALEGGDHVGVRGHCVQLAPFQDPFLEI